MSENEIKENNKLIAKFMGWIVEKNCFSKVEKYGYKLQNERGISVKNRDYHSDLNLLMQVVEKIEDLHKITNGYGFSFKIDNLSVDIKNLFTGELVAHNNPATCRLQSKIESVYISTVEFIKWYNAQYFS